MEKLFDLIRILTTNKNSNFFIKARSKIKIAMIHRYLNKKIDNDDISYHTIESFSEFFELGNRYTGLSPSYIKINSSPVSSTMKIQLSDNSSVSYVIFHKDPEETIEVKYISPERAIQVSVHKTINPDDIKTSTSKALIVNTIAIARSCMKKYVQELCREIIKRL